MQPPTVYVRVYEQVVLCEPDQTHVEKRYQPFLKGIDGQLYAAGLPLPWRAWARLRLNRWIEWNVEYRSDILAN